MCAESDHPAQYAARAHRSTARLQSPPESQAGGADSNPATAVATSTLASVSDPVRASDHAAPEVGCGRPRRTIAGVSMAAAATIATAVPTHALAPAHDSRLQTAAKRPSRGWRSACYGTWVSEPTTSKASTLMLVSVAAAFFVPVQAMVTVCRPDLSAPVPHTFCCHPILAL